MLFSNQKYSEFGIDIFDYADILDFLVEPFSDYRILLFTVLSISAVYLLFLLDTFWNKRFPKSYSILSFGWDKKKWFGPVRYVVFIVASALYLFGSAELYGSLFKKRIINQPTINLRYADNEEISGKVIGKTKNVLFLLNDDQVKAIPIGSVVKEFEIK